MNVSNAAKGRSLHGSGLLLGLLHSKRLVFLRVVCLLCLCLHCFLVLSTELAAQVSTPKDQSESAQTLHNNPMYRTWRETATLRSIASVSQDCLVAVGDRGTILITQDAGRTWRLVPSPTTANLHDVVHDGQVVWAVGGWIGRSTGSSYATILKSTDGGLSWNVLPDQWLPRLIGAQSQAGRLVCWGDYCPRMKSSVFVSVDGGFTWQPAVKGIAHATAANTDSSGQILAVDSLGRSGTSHGPSVSITSPNRQFKLLTATSKGWLAGGEGGELVASSDGLQWSDIPLPIPASSRSLCDWHTVAQHSHRIWIAGSPGSLVLRSDDGGDTWSSSPTGQNLPIHKLCFIDPQRGWAVGAQGSLLATRDGGNTWYSQRQQPSRVSVLAVNRSTETTPWPALVATVWDQQRCAAAISLQHSEPIASSDLKPSHETASVQAARQMGLSEYAVCDASKDHPDLAESRTALHILCWRPDVILSTLSSDDPLSEVKLPQLLSTAIQKAAGQDFQSVAESLYLKPWKVQKLAEVVKPGRGDYSEQAQRILRGSGLAIEEILWILPESDRYKNQQLSMRTLWARSQSRAVQVELLGGATLHPETRMIGELESLGSYQSVMGRGHREKMLRQLLREMEPDLTQDIWEKELRFFAQSLPPRESMGTLMQLAESLIQQNQLQRSYVVLEWISSHHLDQDASRWAGSRLLQLLASHQWNQPRNTQPQFSPGSDEFLEESEEEQIARLSRQQESISVSSAEYESAKQQIPWAATPFPEEDIILVSGTQQPSIAAESGKNNVVNASTQRPLHAESGSSPNDEQVRAFAWLNYADGVLKQHPELRFDPNVLMLFARTLEKSGNVVAARTMLGELIEQPHIVSWHQAALQEIAILDGQESGLKWSVLAALAPEPPQLDGLLNESFWTKSRGMQLTSLTTATSRLATVSWAYDANYLYIAILCHRSQRRQPPQVAGQRSYDTDLSDLDHIELSIDPNREYQAAYEFAVAENGWTYERFMGKTAYNPKWYVQAVAEPDQWRAEIAIPLAELGQPRAQSQTAWTLSARRMEPKSVPQSWSQLKTHLRLPQANGLLLFQ